MKKISLALLALVFLFLTTRTVRLSFVPPAVYWDEASIGYNAFSILKTGQDERGEKFPVHFKAFGEYKLPVYIYSVVPFVRLFGLSEISVRLPAILFSLGSLMLIYLLGLRISKKPLVGLFAALYFTVSPWFFIFSRTGYEATAGVMFYLLSIYLFLISLSRGYYLIPSLLSLGLSFYSYNAFRILVPILLMVMLVSFGLGHREKLTKRLGIMLISVGLFVLMLVPAIGFIRSGSITDRLDAVAIKGVNLRKWEIALEVGKNYLSHFSKDFLFDRGDIISRSQQPGFGELIVFDALLLPLGLYFLLKKERKLGIFIVFLLAISFIPASITWEAPHALRSVAAVPFISLTFAYGAYFLVEKVKLKKEIIIAAIVLLYLGSFEIYLDNFFNNYSKQTAEDWQYGYKLIFQNYQDRFGNYDQILVSDRGIQPYIFGLFYLQYDPAEFRKEVNYNQPPRSITSLVRGFGNFTLRDINYYELPKGRSLIFSHPTDRMTELAPLEIINYPNGEIAFYVYEYEK